MKDTELNFSSRMDELLHKYCSLDRELLLAEQEYNGLIEEHKNMVIMSEQRSNK